MGGSLGDVSWLLSPKQVRWVLEETWSLRESLKDGKLQTRKLERRKGCGVFSPSTCSGASEWVLDGGGQPPHLPPPLVPTSLQRSSFPGTLIHFPLLFGVRLFWQSRPFLGVGVWGGGRGEEKGAGGQVAI
jgi:hypothetical protein